MIFIKFLLNSYKYLMSLYILHLNFWINIRNAAGRYHISTMDLREKKTWIYSGKTNAYVCTYTHLLNSIRVATWRRISHDRGGRWWKRLYRKITRNIAARYEIPAFLFVSIFTIAGTMSLNHATVAHLCIRVLSPLPSCMAPHEYNILSLLDTSVDWKRYESVCRTCLLAAYQLGWCGTRRGIHTIIASLC